MSKKSAATATTPASHTASWVYAGLRLTTDNKLYHVWYDYDDACGIVEDKSHMFAKNIVRWCAIGDVYTVHSDKPDMSSIYTAGLKAPIHDTARRATTDECKQWSLREQTDKTEHERRALVKKTGRDKLLSMTLQELSDFARTQLPERRRALAAYVLSKLDLS